MVADALFTFRLLVGNDRPVKKPLISLKPRENFLQNVPLVKSQKGSIATLTSLVFIAKSDLAASDTTVGSRPINGALRCALLIHCSVVLLRNFRLR